MVKPGPTVPLNVGVVAATAGTATTRNAALTAATTDCSHDSPGSIAGAQWFYAPAPASVSTGRAAGTATHVGDATLRGRAVQRLDRPRLAERVVATEELRGAPRDRVGEVVELEPVRVPGLDRDRLDLGRLLAAGAPGDRDVPAPVDPPGSLDDQHAVLPDDLHPLAPRRAERGLELPDDVVRAAQRPVERHVDPGRPRDLLAAHVLRVARDEADPADAVAADVHQRAAVELRQRTNVRQVLERERERRLDGAEPSDGAARDELAHLRRLGMVAVHEGLGQDQTRLVRGRERLLDLRRATRVRLLAEDVLARGEGMHRPLVVHPVGERDVDGVDVVVRQERLVRRVGALDPVLGGVRLCLCAVAAADRDDVDEVRLGGAAKDLLVDVRCRQQAESHARGSLFRFGPGRAA